MILFSCSPSAFNAGFGITTDFASVAEVDDQGRIVSGGSTSSGAAATASSTSSGAASTAAASTDAATSGGIGDFGSCSVPQIEFGTGFDGRKETAFQPVDKSELSCLGMNIVSHVVFQLRTTTVLPRPPVSSLSSFVTNLSTRVVPMRRLRRLAPLLRPPLTLLLQRPVNKLMVSHADQYVIAPGPQVICSL